VKAIQSQALVAKLVPVLLTAVVVGLVVWVVNRTTKKGN
jgi:hypothetical protein